ncbi:THO complex subunit 4A-like isoform X2 [Coffea arabica]|uniref:THO complex subunit 4A-like isoform X2 n=1 Tax=Coffea arabica TaxID=13443 RepID=A0A6P6VFH7_COFAR|nr:THO complex subunit 4A-like isoform X2 [Coffea arabica]
MADLLDMSLDDLINRNRKSGGDHGNFRGRGGGRGRGLGQAHCMSSGPGPTRRTPVFVPYRTVPYLRPRVAVTSRSPGLWMLEEEGASSGTKLYVSNLYYGVTNDDIKVLFSDVGELKRYAIHYDRTGKSMGTAEVVFARHSDALKAINRYNDLLLDGRPIKIEIIGVDFVPSAVPPSSEGGLGYQSGAFGRDGFKQAGRRGQEGRGKKNLAEKVSAEALDADLEKYHEDALLSS